MANICWFKGVVKGKKINCEKFLEVFPCNEILETCERETNDYYSIFFKGIGNWDICPYATNKKNVSKLSDEEIKNVCNDKIDEFSKYRLIDFSKLFDLVIYVNVMYEDDLKTKKYSYAKGEKDYGVVFPKELTIRKSEIDSFEDNIFDLDSKKENNKGSKNFTKEEALEYSKTKFSTLKYLSDEIKDDEDVVSSFIKYDGKEIRYASERLRNDRNMVFKAFNNRILDDDTLFECIGKTLLEDDKFMADIMRLNNNMGLNALWHMSKSLSNNKEFMLELEEIHSCAVDQFLGEKLVADYDFLIEILKFRKDTYEVDYLFPFVDKTLLKNNRFLEDVINIRKTKEKSVLTDDNVWEEQLNKNG